MIQRICVFCGSNPGRSPIYALAAEALAKALVERNIGLVYGGGAVGLMGVLADAVLRGGGEVIGVIPRGLWDREVGHRGLTRLEIVDTMHQRKAMMAELSDAFVALPGGLGTYEEIFEVWTWSQLGMHEKPCGFVDVHGFYSPLMAFLDASVEAGFIRPIHRETALVDEDPSNLLDRLAAYNPPKVEKWLKKGEE